MALVVFLAVRLAQGEASGKAACCSAPCWSDEELLDELESSTAGLALKGGLALEAALACGSHSPGGPLGLGLGGGGGWRGVGEPDSPFGAATAAGLAPAMGALCTACIRFRTSARMVESDLTLFLNQAALETLGWSGRRPDKYTWYAVSKTGSRRTADAWAGSFPCPLPLPALAFSFALGRVEAIIGSLSLSFSWPLSCSLLHGCSVLGRQLPGQAGAVQAERGKGKA